MLGGDGEDKIVVDDHLDDWNGTEADTFNISFQIINKDGVGLIYSSFESQKIITSGVNSSDFYFPNTVKINSTDMPTEIVGTPGDRDTFVDIGNQANNLGQIFAPITLTFMPGALATVYVHDETATAARQYTVTSTAMTSPRVINYTGVVSLNVYGGTNSDNFNVISTPPAMQVNLRGLQRRRLCIDRRRRAARSRAVARLRHRRRRQRYAVHHQRPRRRVHRRNHHRRLVPCQWRATASARDDRKLLGDQQ